VIAVTAIESQNVVTEYFITLLQNVASVMITLFSFLRS